MKKVFFVILSAFLCGFCMLSSAENTNIFGSGPISAGEENCSQESDTCSVSTDDIFKAGSRTDEYNTDFFQNEPAEVSKKPVKKILFIFLAGGIIAAIFFLKRKKSQKT